MLYAAVLLICLSEVNQCEVRAYPVPFNSLDTCMAAIYEGVDYFESQGVYKVYSYSCTRLENEAV